MKIVRTFYVDNHLALFLHNDFLALIDEDESLALGIDEFAMALFGHYVSLQWGRKPENLVKCIDSEAINDMINHHDTLLGRYRGVLIRCSLHDAKKYTRKYSAILQTTYEALKASLETVETNDPPFQELT